MAGLTLLAVFTSDAITMEFALGPTVYMKAGGTKAFAQHKQFGSSKFSCQGGKEWPVILAQEGASCPGCLTALLHGTVWVTALVPLLRLTV